MDEQFFNEYDYKKIDSRVEIHYLRNSPERLNPWEITNFFSRVSTYMYKIEVVNTIALAINQGIKLKNIFILDKGYKINENYGYFSSISLCSYDINTVYRSGNPVSMTPNADLFEMKLLFTLIYKTNQILQERIINGRKREESYNRMLSGGFDYAVRFISSLFDDIPNGKRKEEAKVKFENESKKILEEHKEFFENLELFPIVERKLDKKNSEKFTEDETVIIRKYFRDFYRYLVKLSRPIVGIYYEKEKEFKILCSDHFDASIDMHTKIDLMSITQNSPLKAIVEAGSIVVSTCYDEKRKREIHDLEREIKELELKSAEKDIIIKNQEIEKNKLTILEKKLKILELSDRLDEGVNNLEDSYAKQNILSIQKGLKRNYNNLLTKNDFIVETEQIIDIKL